MTVYNVNPLAGVETDSNTDHPTLMLMSSSRVNAKVNFKVTPLRCIALHCVAVASKRRARIALSHRLIHNSCAARTHMCCGCTVGVLRLYCAAVLWLYCGCPVPVLRSSTEAVLWLYCACTVVVLWLYCGCTAAVLWLYCAAVLWLAVLLLCVAPSVRSNRPRSTPAA